MPSFVMVQAQSATATLSGTVTDQAGAVIPGVNIEIISIAQGFRRPARTNADGAFVVPLLPAGHYTVKAEHEGFTPAEVPNIILNVNDQMQLTIQLKVGAIGGQTVDIVDTPQLVDDSPAVGTIVDRQFIENQPLNGRSFNALIALTPGVVQSKATSANPGQFSVNGQRANANYFRVDGVSANIGTTPSLNVSQTLAGTVPGLTALGGTNNLVSVDALQEFKVLTSTYAPEFGRTPGGQISMVTRTGTNDFHGSVFDYVRNDVFDANDWFATASRQPKPKERQNDFGAVLSGPVLLPRFGEGGHQSGYDGHNRTFFFFSYEGLRLRQPQVVFNAEVPSISLRQTAVPQIQPFLNAFPVPNGPDLGNGLALFSTSYSNPSTLDATSIRIDHTLNKKLVLFGRYNYAPSESVSRTRDSLSSAFPTTLDTQTLTLAGSSLINPNITNDLRFNYSKTTGKTSYLLDDFGNAIPVSPSQLFPSFASPDDSVVIFQLNFSSLSPSIRMGNNSGSSQRQLNVVDTLSATIDTHFLKLGVDFRRLTPVFLPPVYFQGTRFLNATAVRTGTASLILTQARQPAHPVFKNFSAFAQDTWRASQRLTLTYGLRWELNPPPSAADGNQPFTATGLDDPINATLAPRGTPLFETTYNNFAPRFGVAYQLFQRPGSETILRGGVGLFYDLGTGQAANGFTGTPFTTSFGIASNVPYPPIDSVVQPPAFPGPPFPAATVFAFEPDFKLPRTYQWNFALEQSLGSDQTISASYVGALGRRQVNAKGILNNPRFQTFIIYGNDATSDYHAMQLQFQRRLSRGIQSLVSYTWSHSIDKVSTENGLGLDRGPSDFDVRHVFSAALSYDLPTPSLGTFGKAVLGNWGIDGIVRTQSATPVNVIALQTVNLNNTTLDVRPDLITGVPLYLHDPGFPGERRINPAAFALPPIGPAPARRPLRQGTLGRNALRGLPFNQFDVSMRRRFNLTEQLNMMVRLDVFNVLNHPNFADPASTLFGGFTASGTPIPTPSFGLSQSMLGKGLGTGGANGGFSPLYQVGGPRSMQFSLRFSF